MQDPALAFSNGKVTHQHKIRYNIFFSNQQVSSWTAYEHCLNHIQTAKIIPD